MGLGEAVEVGRRHARAELRLDEGEDLGDDPAGPPHPLDLGGRLDGDLAGAGDGHQARPPAAEATSATSASVTAVGRGTTVDGPQLAEIAVVGDDVGQRAELLGQPRPDRLDPIVLALVERTAVDVADARRARRVADVVVDVAGGPADPAAGHPTDELVGGDLDDDRPVDQATAFGEGLVEGLGLVAVAGETVEDRPALGVAAAESLEEHGDGDLVGDELAALHVTGRLAADGRAVADGRPEQVAGRHVRYAEPRREDRRLGALSGAGGAEEDHHGHRMNPS